MKGTAYLLQASLLILWWIGMFFSQDFFNAFQFPGIGKIAFYSFFIPDLILIAVFSLIRAYKPIRALEFIILGGFAYAALYCINASILTHGGYLATTTMTLGLFYNIFLAYQNLFFRQSNSKQFKINAFKTLLQIICVWGVTLLLFPMLILIAFDEILSPNFGLTTTIGILLICGFGLRSAFIMVKKGEGTPLPVDQTNKLVIVGPYKYVRNPMAIAGVGQGIAVSLIFTSLPIFFYSILGGVLWHVVGKPIEEKNLSDRFGTQYKVYSQHVKYWIPNFKLNKKLKKMKLK